MHAFLDNFLHAETGELLLVLVIVLFVGSKVAAGHEGSRKLGLFLAASALVAFFLWGLQRQPFADVALRGLLGAGIVLGVSWIVLPPAGFVLDALALKPWRASRRALAAARGRRELQRRDRQTAADAKRREQERARSRTQEEQRRLQHEAQSRLTTEARQAREDARARVEVAYSLVSPEVSTRMTRESFDQFLARYMGDDKPPEEVERRAQQLLDLIQQHADKVSPTDNLSQEQRRQKERDAVAAKWTAYQDRKQIIEESDLGDIEKQTLINELKEQLYEDLRPKRGD